MLSRPLTTNRRGKNLHSKLFFLLEKDHFPPLSHTVQLGLSCLCQGKKGSLDSNGIFIQHRRMQTINSSLADTHYGVLEYKANGLHEESLGSGNIKFFTCSIQRVEVLEKYLNFKQFSFSRVDNCHISTPLSIYNGECIKH